MRSELEYVPYLLSNVVEINLKPMFSISLTQLTVHQLQLIIKRATNALPKRRTAELETGNYKSRPAVIR